MRTPPCCHRKSGIYKITCLPSGKHYIGSAVNLAARIRCHRFDLIRGRHHNRYLQRAWRKHGAKGFRVEVVELCEPFALLLREQFHIDNSHCLQPRGFNLTPKAGSCLGLKRSKKNIENMRKCRLGKPLSEATKAKLSRSLKRVCKGKVVPRSMIDKAALVNRGRPLTAEHRAKIGAAHKGKKRPTGMMSALAEFNRGKKRKPETVEKMRAAAKQQWKTKKENEHI